MDLMTWELEFDYLKNPNALKTSDYSANGNPL